MRPSTPAELRKRLRALLAAGAALGPLSDAAPARAAEFVPEESTMTLRLGPRPAISTTAVPWVAPELIAAPSHPIALRGPLTLWSIPPTPVTSLFEELPGISSAEVSRFADALHVEDGFLATNHLGGGETLGPGYGGAIGMGGLLVIHSMTGTQVLGVGPGTLQGYSFFWDTEGFFTGPAHITGITTEVVTIPARGNVQGVRFTLQPTSGETVMTLSTNGGYVSMSGGAPLVEHTVSISGTNSLLSSVQGGSVTVVAPMRIETDSIAGNIPGAMSLRFVFVPEPTGTLLLAAGIAGLVGLERLRRRRRERDPGQT